MNSLSIAFGYVDNSGHHSKFMGGLMNEVYRIPKISDQASAWSYAYGTLETQCTMRPQLEICEIYCILQCHLLYLTIRVKQMVP